MGKNFWNKRSTWPWACVCFHNTVGVKLHSQQPGQRFVWDLRSTCWNWVKDRLPKLGAGGPCLEHCGEHRPPDPRKPFRPAAFPSSPHFWSVITRATASRLSVLCETRPGNDAITRGVKQNKTTTTRRRNNQPYGPASIQKPSWHRSRRQQDVTPLWSANRSSWTNVTPETQLRCKMDGGLRKADSNSPWTCSQPLAPRWVPAVIHHRRT